jgi:hypothetical protein
VPAAAGAYLLLRRGRVLCAGVAAGGATLRHELAAHKRGEFGGAMQAATHFSYEACDSLQAYGVQLDVHAHCDLRQLPRLAAVRSIDENKRQEASEGEAPALARPA